MRVVLLTQAGDYHLDPCAQSTHERFLPGPQLPAFFAQHVPLHQGRKRRPKPVPGVLGQPLEAKRFQGHAHRVLDGDPFRVQDRLEQACISSTSGT